MIFVGPAGYPRGYKDPLHALRMVAGMGLNALEMQFVRQVRMQEERARQIGSLAEELGIVLSAHAPYYVNFNSTNPETVEKSVGWVVKTCEIADFLGAWVVVIHAARYSGKTSEETTRAVIDGLNRCLDIMNESDVHVKLGIETMGERSAWGRIEEIREVAKAIKEVVPVLDFAHIHAIGGGALKTEEDFSKVLERCSSFYRGRLHCHFSCVEYSERGEVKHLGLSFREPDFEPLARALSRWGEDVTVISETPEPEVDAVVMREMLHHYSES